MNLQQPDGHDLREPKADDTYLPDMTPRREGGDDSLAEASPYDPRNDEKVIANKSSNPRMDAASQTTPDIATNKSTG